MPEPTYLDLVAEDGHPLRHKYLQQGGDPTGLVVSLPGDNYGVDGPLLYYPNQLFWREGWDTVAITYGYQSAGKPFTPLAIPEVLGECQRAIEILLRQREYQKVVLMGKSLGASLVALLCQQMSLPPWTRAVYLTPPLGAMFNPIFLETTQLACLALGTADRFYDPQALIALQQAKTFHLIQIEAADHSLNIKGDLEASLDVVKLMSEEVLAFIRASETDLN
jgi:predicted alpha/beta-hydrolase family hydrolase